MAPNGVNWAARRAVGKLSGPPVETGATLPYREPPVAISFSMPTSSVSRSVTSGARQPQDHAQGQVAQMPPVPQPTLSTPASSGLQSHRQAEINFNKPLAARFPLSSAASMMPSLPAAWPKAGSHAMASDSAVPSNSPAPNVAPAGVQSALAQSISAAPLAQITSLATQSLPLAGKATSHGFERECHLSGQGNHQTNRLF